MPTPEQDLHFLEVAIPELKDYLLSDILFWPLGAKQPRLTIGGLLLAQRRLRAQHLGVQFHPKIAALREKWHAAWERKAAKEVNARLDLWRNYLNDYRSNPESHAINYRHEVRWRVMLELLLTDISADLIELTTVDELLKGKLVPDKFIWKANLENQFSQDQYWFLYGFLPD
ncbi:MAG: hypothetical protein HQ525_06070 [Anaerolineae bacterium]|nr:hypothetical protein [Anaerolineae bacterium]